MISSININTQWVKIKLLSLNAVLKTSVVNIVPDSDTPICFVYLGQPVVKDHSGKGISQSIVDQLSRYDIKKNQLEGASFDGQYFILNVPDHLCKLFSLSSTFIATWDPLHRAGIVDSKIRKDVGFKWLVDLQTKCSSIYKKLNWGKNYELLIETCDMIEQHLANIPTFCATRFANSVRFIFISIGKDYKPIIECLKKMLDENIFNEEQENSVDVSKKLLWNIQNIKLCGNCSKVSLTTFFGQKSYQSTLWASLIIKNEFYCEESFLKF